MTIQTQYVHLTSAARNCFRTWRPQTGLCYGHRSTRDQPHRSQGWWQQIRGWCRSQNGPWSFAAGTTWHCPRMICHKMSTLSGIQVDPDGPKKIQVSIQRFMSLARFWFTLKGSRFGVLAEWPILPSYGRSRAARLFSDFSVWRDISICYQLHPSNFHLISRPISFIFSNHHRIWM